MAINYAAMQATALRLIEENGQAITFRRMAEGSYDPLTLEDAAVPTDYPTTAVLVRLNEGVDDYDVQALGGSFAIGRAKKAIIPASDLPDGVEPIPGDRLILANGDVWNVRGNNPIDPAGLPLVHIVIVTR